MSTKGDSSKDVKIDVSVKADFKPVLESAPSGFRRIFHLIFGDRHAKNDRLIRLSEAQTDVDVQKILSGEAQFDTGERILTRTNTLSLKQLIVDAIDDEETSNLLQCSVHAAQATEESQTEESESTISRDFILKWRSEAKLISDETAQAIWGRILSEEVKQPGSISARSLDVIKNLTPDEARKFNTACNFVVYGSVLPDNKKNSPISQNDFSALRDAGLITSYTPGMYRASTWWTTTITTRLGETIEAYFAKVGRYFIFTEKSNFEHSEEPSFCYWELTKPGKELYNIISDSLDIPVETIAEAIRDNEGQPKSLKYTTYLAKNSASIDTDAFKSI